jgi:phospholipid/cholesterol/gamma-HCH transport system substrate-binding protein
LNASQPTPKFAPAHKSLGRFWIGLAIFSAIGLMSLSAWRQGWFTPTDHLYLDLSNGAQGLQVGTLVKLKGFKIGEVDEMTLEPNLNVHVSMRVTEEKLALLGADALVKLSRDTPISAKYIEIIPGTKPQGTLKAEAIIPIKEGSEVEDMLLIVKGGVEKLSSALGKIEPILDDAKKLTSEAADMRKQVRSTVDVMLNNLQAVSGNAKQMGQTAQGMVTSMDADRGVIMGQVKGIVRTLETTATTVSSTVTADAPQITGKVKAALDDVKKITEGATIDIPPMLRSTRIATEDATEITDSVKKTWPISSVIKTEPAPKALRLDAFEAGR